MRQRLRYLGSAASQLLNMLTAFDLSDTGPNESVSARFWRQDLTVRRKIVDWFFFLVFRQSDHCQKAHLSDVHDARVLLTEIGETSSEYTKN